MPITLVLQDIARRASGLQLPALPAKLRARDAASQAAVRLAWKRWLRFGGGGDWRVLKKRMRAEGLRPSSLYQPAQLGVLPDWCSVLGQVMVLAQGFDASACSKALPAADKTALAELFAPLLVVARQQLADLARDPRADISDAAMQDLELALLGRLAELAGPCVVTLFNEFKQAVPGDAALNAALSPMLAALMPAATAAARGRYQAFVAAQWADGYQAMFTRFPVLARLLSLALVQWADMVAEFLARAAHDRGALASTFCPTEVLGAITRVALTLSDAHAGGRSVMKVTFATSSGAGASEMSVAYKPRPSEMEAAFSDVLDWLNARTPSAVQKHRVPRMLCGSRGLVDGQPTDYGWMEWIAAEPMAEGEQAAYHWRLGSLMGLYRALGGIDLHIENAVAAGAYPVLIDVECLLHPSSQPFMQAQAGQSDVEDATAMALVNMGALPNYSFSSGGLFSIGLFGTGAAQTGPDMLTLSHPNTDWMAMRRTPQAMPWQQLPQTALGPVDSRPFAADVAQGYRDTLKLVLAHREDLLSGPVHRMRYARGRHLARTTGHYGALLNESLQPNAQSSGVLFDVSFEVLHRHIASLPSGYQAMAPAEREDLRQLDVPRFMFDAASRHVLTAHGEPLGECHVQTPYDRMATALRALTPEQADWEARVLAKVLCPPAADKGHASALVSQQLRGPDGQLVWFSLSSGPDGTRVKPLGLGLYSGHMGVALALASAGAAQRDAGLRRLAIDTLQQVVNDVTKLLDQNNSGDVAGATGEGIMALIGPGLDSGAAGLLFGLQASLPVVRGDDAVVATDMEALAFRFVSDVRFSAMVANDKRLDLLGGTAGLLLSLLSWHRTAAMPQRPTYLQAALQCGERLLSLAKHEQKADGTHLSWPIHSAIGLSGLSHGGSGFAVAFAALYKATGDAVWLERALGALRHEATLYSAERLNWRDLRDFTPKEASQESLEEGIGKVRYFGVSWCHGAPGVALARAALLRMLGDELPTTERDRLSADLDVALATNLRVLQLQDADMVDDLCCGSAGRIDILLECGRLLNRPELVAQAQSFAKAKLDAWQNSAPGAGSNASPFYWYQDKTLRLTGSELGLFKGMAGWPYVAARVAAPDLVPCVLLPLSGLV